MTENENVNEFFPYFSQLNLQLVFVFNKIQK